MLPFVAFRELALVAALRARLLLRVAAELSSDIVGGGALLCVRCQPGRVCQRRVCRSRAAKRPSNRGALFLRLGDLDFGANGYNGHSMLW